MSAEEGKMVLSALDSIDPGCSYDDWIAVGMALHNDGYPFEYWDDWSMRDPEYPGSDLLRRHWDSFRQGRGVTVGTIIHMARQNGWDGGEFDLSGYNAPPKAETKKVVEFDEDAIKTLPVRDLEHATSDDATTNEQIALYVGAVYELRDSIMFCRTKFSLGDNVRSAANVLAMAEAGNSGFSADTGGGNGYYVCINPVVPGRSRKTEDIAAYRCALIECDPGDDEDYDASKARQLDTIKKLRLPCRAIVDSGNKSIHAIVRIDAKDLDSYRDRVEYIMAAFRATGMEPDKACKNCNRLTRLPGIMRGDMMQRLIATDEGFPSFAEWYRWASQFEIKGGASSKFSHPLSGTRGKPKRKPVLIDGLLRFGHKLIVTAPGKAGKTFLMIELAVAVAMGGEWLGMKCEQGNVVFIDPEVDPISWECRFYDVCEAMGYDPFEVRERVFYRSYRGEKASIREIVDEIIDRFAPDSIQLTIFDSIYMIFEGNENDAQDARKFFSEDNRLFKTIGCATAMSHHYGKGPKGDLDAKDRGRGSSVFSDDPDAPITMVEIFPPADEEPPDDGLRYYRIEDSGLREFPPHGAIDVVFDYPIHRLVTDGSTASWKPKTMQSVGGKASGATRQTQSTGKANKACEAIFDELESSRRESMTISEAVGVAGTVRRTLERYVEGCAYLEKFKDGNTVRIRRRI